MCTKSFADLSNLQKHRKTHKLPETAEADDTAPVTEETEEGADLPFPVTGQHIIYVSEDHTQLLISTIGPEQAGLTGEEAEGDGAIESIMMDTAEPSEGASVSSLPEGTLDEMEQPQDNVLTIVGVDGDQSADQQAVEFTTQNGERVRLFIPANVDPYQFTADYLASLSE